MRRFALAFALAIAVLAEEPSSIVHLVRQLGHEDAAVREAAEKELVQLGATAVEPLRKELSAAGDPEVRGRLASCIRKIESEVARAKYWKEAPDHQIEAFLGGSKCSCGNAKAWKPVEVTHEDLTALFPRARFFVLDWTCCQDKPVRSRLIAVCREPDAVVEIHGMHSWKGFRAWCAEAKTPELASRIGACLAGLAYAPAPEPPFTFRIDEATVKQTEKGTEVLIRARGSAVKFDADGKLEWGSVMRG